MLTIQEIHFPIKIYSFQLVTLTFLIVTFRQDQQQQQNV